METSDTTVTPNIKKIIVTSMNKTIEYVMRIVPKIIGKKLITVLGLKKTKKLIAIKITPLIVSVEATPL